MNDEVPASDSDGSGIHWKQVRNTFTEAIPANGLMRVTGVDDDGTFAVSQPDADSMTGLLICGSADIPAGLTGQAHNEFPCAVLFDANGWTPTAGNACGSAANSWLLTAGKTGFMVVGGDTTDGLVVVSQDVATGNELASQVVTVVTKVCPTIAGGVVTHITTEYTAIRVAPGDVLATWCITDPTGCCPNGSGSGSGSGCYSCCTTTQLCVVVTNTNLVTELPACLNGLAFVLNYDAGSAQWASDWQAIPGGCTNYISYRAVLTCFVETHLYPDIPCFPLYLLTFYAKDTLGFSSAIFGTGVQPDSDLVGGRSGRPLTVTDCTSFLLPFTVSTPGFALVPGAPFFGDYVKFLVSSDLSVCASGSGSGSGSGCVGDSSDIASLNLGATSNQDTNILTLAAITVTAGKLLVVNVAIRALSGVDFTLTFNGTGVPSGPILQVATDAGPFILGAICYLSVVADTTGDIVLEVVGAAATDIALSAVQVSCLGNNENNQAVSASNTAGSTTPDAGAFASPSFHNYLQGAIITNGPNSDTPGTWSNSFSSGGQDIGTSRLFLREGYRIVITPTATGHPAMTGITSRAWVALGAAFI